MLENHKEAAKRLAGPMLVKGFKPIALHTYTDAEGNPLFWRIRLKHPVTGEKWIRPLHRDGSRFQLAEPEFSAGKPLYALHRITTNPDAVVWVTEGEQKADALNRLGLVATTSGGFSSAAGADWTPLRGRTVRIWPDNDRPGKDYAGEVAKILLSLDCAVSCVDVAKLGLVEKGDVVDWLTAHPEAAGGDIEALLMLPAQRRPRTALEGESAGRIAYRRVSEIEAKPIRWLWQGRIARGKVSILAGNPGLGKSQVTASMAAVVTKGGAWPVDRTRCERGNVVILSAEDDPEDTIRPRLEAAGADIQRAFILDAVVDSYRADGGEVRRAFNLKTDIARLGEMLEEIGGAALVVIDPITAYLGDTDSHKNAEIRALLSPLSDMAAKHGAAVVCVSHFNKAAAGEALMRVTGSLAFVAAARAAYVVTKDKEDDARRLFLPLKNNIGNNQTGLAFAVQSAQVQSPKGLIETSRVSWEAEAVTVTADEAMAAQGDPEERSATDEAQDWLRDLLGDGPMNAVEIQKQARQAGISDRALRRARERLGIKPDKSSYSGGWQWRLDRHEDAPKMPQGPQDAPPRKRGHLRWWGASWESSAGQSG